jgi:uncharacterized membrane protein
MTHLAIALAADGKSPWTWLFGALHPGTVHFPIALLVVAAFLEALQILRKKPEAAPGTPVLAYLAAASAVPAAFFGFQLAAHGGNEGDLINLHKWFGIGSTVVALIAAIGAWKSKSSRAWLRTMRAGLLAAAGLVLVTGYLGGEMTGGEGHILKPLYTILGMSPAHAEDQKGANVSDTTPPDKKDPPLLPSKDPKDPPAAGKVDFAKEIAPIIRDMCFRCHGGEKVKGKFKLNTKALAMAGGDSGKEILPGKGSLSKFYTSMALPLDDDDVMPPKKEKPRPSKEQIDRVLKWIDQGAEWPDGYEFKK